VAGVGIEEDGELSSAHVLARTRPWAVPVRALELVVRREPRFEPSAGFYARVWILGALAAAAFGALGLRLWSLQVLRHPRYAQAALSQASRVVPVQAGRGPIVDRKGRLLAGTEAQIVVSALPERLGAISHGVWRPSSRGEAVLERLVRAGGGSVAELVGQIRKGLARSPYTAVTLFSPSTPLADYLDEHRLAFPRRNPSRAKTPRPKRPAATVKAGARTSPISTRGSKKSEREQMLSASR
jgi:cell division protein FtsI/penicillin-binding protein 2